MSIIIFSRPVHSGKTTELLQWCNQQKNIAGIAMPDINGCRKIFDLQTKELFDIECMDTANTTEPITTVGRFRFYTAAFEKANAILIKSLSHHTDWLLIDEVGKLELQDKGFYPAILKAAVTYNNKETTGNLLLTVREYLCDEVIAFFKLKNCRVINQLEDITR